MTRAAFEAAVISAIVCGASYLTCLLLSTLY